MQSVRAIGERAFEKCEQLEQITFAEGSSLKTLGDSVFNQCIRLKAINLPSGLSAIGNACFQNSGLKDAYIPLGATIGENAFPSAVLTVTKEYAQ